MSYSTNGETDIIAIVGEKGVRCIPHAIRDYFNGDTGRFDDIDTGRSTDFTDTNGFSYEIIHEGSVQYDTTGEWMRTGLFCEADDCEAVLIEPVEDDDEYNPDGQEEESED